MYTYIYFGVIIMKNKFKVLIIFTMIFTFLTGCAKVKDLTPEENGIIAEYAAGVLLKYSPVYKDKYEDLSDDFVSTIPDQFETESSTEETTSDNEEETTTASGDSDNPTIKPSDEPDSEQESSTEEVEWHIEKEMGLEPLTMKFDSYVVTNEYPDDEDAIFTFTAEEGYTFLVLKFQLHNDTSQKVTINNHDKRPAIKAYINDNQPIYNYANLMMNDITALKDVTVEAGDYYDGIIVYMVKETELAEITSLKISYNEHEVVVKK